MQQAFFKTPGSKTTLLAKQVPSSVLRKLSYALSAAAMRLPKCLFKAYPGTSWHGCWC